jgi:propanol-preferring alcohol dehydrogenase
MQAMVLRAPSTPLTLDQRPDLQPGPGEVRLAVLACAVCRTDLHIVDGDLPLPRLPLVPGHEIVGRIDALGAGVGGLQLGQRVGVPWLGGTCGHCAQCGALRENLCDSAQFTGYTRDGGFATQALANASFCFSLEGLPMSDVAAAPLLCAGLIGWRALKKAGDARVLGLYGFGASAHLIAQVAVAQGRRVHAFTRRGDTAAQAHALSLGAVWAGSSDEAPPEPLDAAILFAPVGALVPLALAAVRPGGCVVCAGLHMSDTPPSRMRCCGRKGRCCRWPTSPVPMATSSWPWRARCRCRCTPRVTRWRRPTRPCTTCAAVRSRGPPCWCPECRRLELAQFGCCGAT